MFALPEGLPPMEPGGSAEGSLVAMGVSAGGAGLFCPKRAPLFLLRYPSTCPPQGQGQSAHRALMPSLCPDNPCDLEQVTEVSESLLGEVEWP